jgi:hypothetical protein
MPTEHDTARCVTNDTPAVQHMVNHRVRCSHERLSLKSKAFVVKNPNSISRLTKMEDIDCILHATTLYEA